MDEKTNALPVIRLSAETGTRPLHFVFTVDGNILYSIVEKRTVVGGQKEGEEKTFSYVEQSKTSLGKVSSIEEMEEKILGHMRWCIDQAKRKLIPAQRAAIQAAIEAGNLADATLAAKTAAQAAPPAPAPTPDTIAPAPADAATEVKQEATVAAEQEATHSLVD